MSATSTRHPAAQLPSGYPELLAQLKARITTARTRAALAVNRELVVLYWEIGRHILQRERQAGWGAKVIEQLAADLRREFPDMTGLSRSNLHYMRQFAAAWPDSQIVPAELRHARQVRRTHPVGRHVDELARVHIPSSAQAHRRILQQHGLADPPSSTQHHELVVNRAVSDVVEQARAVAQVIGSSGAKHLVALHPEELVCTQRRCTPPRIAVAEPLAPPANAACHHGLGSLPPRHKPPLRGGWASVQRRRHGHTGQPAIVSCTGSRHARLEPKRTAKRTFRSVRRAPRSFTPPRDIQIVEAGSGAKDTIMVNV